MPASLPAIAILSSPYCMLALLCHLITSMAVSGTATSMAVFD